MFGPNTVVTELAYNPQAHVYLGKYIFLKMDKGKLTIPSLLRFSLQKGCVGCANLLREATVETPISVQVRSVAALEGIAGGLAASVPRARGLPGLALLGE